MPEKEKKKYNIECLRQDVERKVGRTINTPSDFNFLYLKIRNELNEAPSVSTLKRMWVYVSNTSSRSMSTLNILARYVGYRDWNDYVERLMRDKRVESGFLTVNTFLSSNLHPGDRVVCTWNPGRRLVAEYIGDNRYVVRQTELSKLPVGTTFSALIFTKGLPLCVSNVESGGNMLGSYVAGEKTGLTSLNFIPGV